MRFAGAILIILGILFAVVAGLALFVLYPRQVQRPPEFVVDVVIALQAIPERTEVSYNQVGKASWSSNVPLPPGALKDPEEAVGKMAKQAIYAGQPVIAAMLAEKEKDGQYIRSNAAYILPRGTLAVALPVNTDSNVAGAVQVGDRVDVIATFTVKQGTDGKTEAIVTQRLLQDVLVLQVGIWPRAVAAAPTPTRAPTQTSSNSLIGTSAPSTTTQSTQPSTVVTLQLQEQDVLVLQNMQATARDFTLALRAAGDHAMVNPTPVTLDYLQDRFGFRNLNVGR